LIQGHTYWHPTQTEKRKLSPSDYENRESAASQLKTLEDKLGSKTLLAWPFGIYDGYLEQEAAKQGMLWRLVLMHVLLTEVIDLWHNHVS
jgi:hypothetical protein